jgi:ATP-binding cassette subfamily F protein uup
MAPPLLQLDDIRLTFGGSPLLEGASLVVEPRARIALVGRNGSGKSTLLKIAAGQIEPDGGRRFLDPKSTAAYLPQDPVLPAGATVRAIVEEGRDAALRVDIEPLMADLGLDPARTVDNLSGGEARRTAIARALAGAPDILLLDEPTNHLDLPAIEWLEDRLGGGSAALVLISHDRRFLEKLTNRTLWLDRGRTRQLNAGFSAFEEWRDKTLEEEEQAAHKLDRKIVDEEHWVRYGVTARRKRNMRRMRELQGLRETRLTARRKDGAVAFSANEAEVSGKRVIVAEKITKSFGGRAVVADFSIEIARGDRVGFVGANGAGKTTLLNMLTGALAPDKGGVTLGSGLAMVRLDQKRAALDENARVADAITDGRGDWVTINAERKHVSTYLKEFLFKPEQWRSPVKALSGGERGRLALAAALAKPSNLIILDEPTNDLDIETLDLLQEFLAESTATILVVSHDRSFLDRVATSIVAPAPGGRDGQWTEYVGGYSDMLAQRGAAPPAKAPPQRTQNQSAPAAATPAARTKLSFKEKFALEQAPAKMEKLAAEIATLKATLADGGLFKRAPLEFADAARKLEAAEALLSATEEEWLALEMKREALEQS